MTFTASEKVQHICTVLLEKASKNDLDLHKMDNPHNDVLEVLGAISLAQALKREAIKPLSVIKEELASSPFGNLPTLDTAFEKVDSSQKIQTIAEIKFSSPSANRIAPPHLNAVSVADGYLKNGATALSILCEEIAFGGSLEFLFQVRAVFPDAFLLQKDFLLTPYQVYEGRLSGASSFLIIMSLVSEEQLENLLKTALELGIVPVIEIHNNQELDEVLEWREKYPDVIKIIGVNNRNLATFAVSLEHSKNIDIDKANDLGIITLSESGLNTHADAVELKSKGYDAFLVGTAFMKTNDPSQALLKFLEG